MPSISIPPWAGGVSLWGSPLGVTSRDVPEVHPSGPHYPAPLVSISCNVVVVGPLHCCCQRCLLDEKSWLLALPPTVPRCCCSQRTVRCGMASCEILGTSLTCSLHRVVVELVARPPVVVTVCGTVEHRGCCTMVVDVGHLFHGVLSEPAPAVANRRVLPQRVRNLAAYFVRGSPPPRLAFLLSSLRSGAETWPGPQRSLLLMSLLSCLSSLLSLLCSCCSRVVR